jgi:hypothetical protein
MGLTTLQYREQTGVGLQPKAILLQSERAVSATLNYGALSICFCGKHIVRHNVIGPRNISL